MSTLNEMDALQRWLVRATGLSSLRMMAAPPTLARPVVLWEMPNRSRSDRQAGRYTSTSRVRAFARLLVENLDQLLVYQDRMLASLESQDRMIPVYADTSETAAQIAWLTNIDLDFTESSDTNPQFILSYDVTYVRPAPYTPPPDFVQNKTIIQEEG